MTTAEAAEALGRSVHTIRNQIKAGKLRARMVGRDWSITPAEVERYRRASLGKHLGGAPRKESARDPRKDLAPLRFGGAEVVPRFCPAPKPSQRKRSRKVSAK